jgi:hypothetical protein
VKLARIFAVCAVLACTLPATRSSAATTTTTPGDPSEGPAGVSLASQSAWVPLAGTFTMFLHLDDPDLASRAGAAISVTVHESASTRSAFDAAIANDDLGGVVYQPDPLPVESLLRNAKGDVAVVFGLAGSGVRPTIGVSRPGVYPVEVALTNTGRPARSFVTWLITADTSGGRAIETRLLVSWILPVMANPTFYPDGSPDPAVVAQFEPKGRLDRISTVLARARGVPLSLVVGPETVESWERLAARDDALAPGLARVRATSRDAGTEILPGAYVPIDDTALEAAGLGDRLPEEFVKGGNVVRSVLGTPTSTRTQGAFVDPVDDAAIDRLRQMLVDQVAVRDTSLVPVAHPFTPAQTFTLQTAGGTSRAVATAPFIEQLLESQDSSALKAARVLASLSEVAYETPGVARGLAVAETNAWTPDVTAMTTIMRALRNNPLLAPATLDRLITDVPLEEAQDAPRVRQLLPHTPAPTPVDPADFDRASSELAAYAGVVGADDPTVSDGTQALAVALATTITPDRAAAELSKVDGIVSSFTHGIATDAKRVTLTARHAKIPLSFQNNIKPGRTVKVRVHLDSAKLTFPDGADQIITLPPGSTTKRIPVVARASGTFPMTITLTSEDGRLAIGSPVRVTVRSAVFGGLAVGLTIAALLFLAAWWFNHVRRTRKARRAAATADA